jgi:hypothetical protein
MSNRHIRECDGCPDACAGEAEIIQGTDYIQITMTVVRDHVIDRDINSLNITLTRDRHINHLDSECLNEMKDDLLAIYAERIDETATSKRPPAPPAYRPLPLLGEGDTIESVFTEVE